MKVSASVRPGRKCGEYSLKIYKEKNIKEKNIKRRI